jgi:nucleotidyltransferase/DNA polymerase involved in DNA repair
MSVKQRRLGELISVGPAMLRDFELLGVRSVAELARQDPEKMYRKLGRVAQQHQDICVLDVFRAAVAQARNPRLPAEKCQWWWWSEKRKRRRRSPRSTQSSQRRTRTGRR